MNCPIIVATDFSARADRAIDRAVMLGEQWDCPVTLVHSLDRKQAEIFDSAALDRQMRAVLPEGVPGVEKVAFAYPEGPAPQGLAQAADAADAGLVLMGPARHNSLRDFLLGTAVDYALRHCDQPILIVKSRPHRPYGRIIAATDYSAPSRKAIEVALEWFPEAEFHIVHGCHMPFDAWQKADYVREDVLRECKGRMVDFVASLDVSEDRRAKLETHVEMGSAFDVVNRLGAERQIDLVVIGSHGESGFRHATIGSVANELLEATLIDTLMVKSPG